MADYYYINGKVVPAQKAFIHVRDLGLLRAYAVFDFLRTYNGRPFLIKEHLNRLARSAAILDLKIPLSQARIAEIVTLLLRKSKRKEASVRIVLTGGDTFAAKHDNKKRSFYITIEDSVPLSPRLYREGGKLVTHEYQRTFPTAKTTNYAVALSLAKERKEKNAVETLYTSNGEVLEATTSNFFIFKGDKLITPKNNILIGMTRNLVIELAKDQFVVEERPIKISELAQANEAFITATNKEIVPIVKIDDMYIGDGKVGYRTKALMSTFKEFVKDN